MSKIVALFGAENTGKTSLALGFMLEIISGHEGAYGVYHDTEQGVDRAFRTFKWKTLEDAEASGIQIHSYKRPMQLQAKVIGVEELWQRFLQQYFDHLTDPNCLVQAIGTHTELWTINHEGWLQVLQGAQEEAWAARGWRPGSSPPGNQSYRKQLIQIEFGPSNKRQSAMLYSSKQYNKHLILEHHEVEGYRSTTNTQGESVSVPSGSKVPDGFNKTKDISDLMLQIKLATRTVNGTRKLVPSASWAKAPLDLMANNESLDNPTWTSIMALTS